MYTTMHTNACSMARGADKEVDDECITTDHIAWVEPGCAVFLGCQRPDLDLWFDAGYHPGPRHELPAWGLHRLHRGKGLRKLASWLSGCGDSGWDFGACDPPGAHS